MTVTKHPWSVMCCGVSGGKADGLRGGHRTGSLPPAVPKAAPVLWGAEGRGVRPSGAACPKCGAAVAPAASDARAMPAWLQTGTH